MRSFLHLPPAEERPKSASRSTLTGSIGWPGTSPRRKRGGGASIGHAAATAPDRRLRPSSAAARQPVRGSSNVVWQTARAVASVRASADGGAALAGERDGNAANLA